MKTSRASELSPSIYDGISASATRRLRAMDMGTHCYVGTLACGCGVAITRDIPGYEKDTAKDVASFIAGALVVTRLPHKEACELFAAKCDSHKSKA